MNVRVQRATVVGVLVVVIAAVVGSAGAASGVAPGAQSPPSAAPSSSEPDAGERRLRRDLDALADAWSLGGGRFGFPYWEKASQRWTAGQLSTALFREYVAGYRDRLRSGCDLLRATEVDSDAAWDVRSLLVDSCSRRMDALKAQQRWLDALLGKDAAMRIEPNEGGVAAKAAPSAAAVRDAADLDAQAVSQEQEFRDSIQESFRDARLALDLAQRELDHAGVQRLPEDAFI